MEFCRFLTCVVEDESFTVTDTWADTMALKVSAAFRHLAQEALKCRSWVPKDSFKLRALGFGVYGCLRV